MGHVKENLSATRPEPGAIVVCRFPHDGLSTRLTLCLYVARSKAGVLVRKAMGSPFGYRASRWRWSVARVIPVEDVLRLATDRERSVRHPIGGGEGEKLTGAGAGEARR